MKRPSRREIVANESAGMKALRAYTTALELGCVFLEFPKSQSALFPQFRKDRGHERAREGADPPPARAESQLGGGISERGGDAIGERGDPDEEGGEGARIHYR